MSTPLGFSIKQVTYHQGAQWIPEGPSSTFQFIVQGEEPSAAQLEQLLPRVPELWSDFPMVFPAENWFQRACGGKPDNLADWTAALISVFQWLAMDPIWGARVLSKTAEGRLVVSHYLRKQVFYKSLEWALRHLMLWLKTGDTQREALQLAKELSVWLQEARSGGATPTAFRILNTARALGVPAWSPGLSYVSLGYGAGQRRVEGSFGHQTSAVASRFVRNKYLAGISLSYASIPVPMACLPATIKEAETIVARWGWPVVIKPVALDQGEGVVTGIRSLETLREAYAQAARLCPAGVLMECHVQGDDFRLLVVKGKCLVVTRRRAAGVTGDGRQTVKQLLAQLNADPRRGKASDSMLIHVPVDAELLACLKEQSLGEESIPAQGQPVYFRRIANISQGGTAEDYTDRTHPDNLRLAERAAAVAGLDFAGVDFLTPDITRSWLEVGGFICEVNAQPGIRVHWLATPERDIDREIFEALHQGHEFRIPIAAVTGTNGKTTTCRMLQHILRASGKRTGLSTTHGVQIDDEILSTQNCSGEPGGRFVLNNPAVEAAVLEMPRQGLIRFGHPCDYYDVAGLMNVQHDHLGEFDIHTLSEMAIIKARLLERAKGAVVLNAQDPNCMSVLDFVKAPRIILTSDDEACPTLRAHLQKGGEAVYSKIHDGKKVLIHERSGQRTLLLEVGEIPATMGGLLSYNVINALFSIGLAYGLNVPDEAIRKGLQGFDNTPECNPGRYNFFHGFKCPVLLDFAHNLEGVSELVRVAQALPVSGKRWLVSTVIGNRFRSSLNECIPELAGKFDHYILGCDPKTIARSVDYDKSTGVAQMLGLFRSGMEAQGVPSDRLLTESDPVRAIRLALASAAPGDLVVITGVPATDVPMLRALERDCLASPVGLRA